MMGGRRGRGEKKERMEKDGKGDDKTKGRGEYVSSWHSGARGKITLTLSKQHFFKSVKSLEF